LQQTNTATRLALTATCRHTMSGSFLSHAPHQPPPLCAAGPDQSVGWPSEQEAPNVFVTRTRRRQCLLAPSRRGAWKPPKHKRTPPGRLSNARPVGLGSSEMFASCRRPGFRSPRTSTPLHHARCCPDHRTRRFSHEGTLSNSTRRVAAGPRLLPRHSSCRCVASSSTARSPMRPGHLAPSERQPPTLHEPWLRAGYPADPPTTRELPQLHRGLLPEPTRRDARVVTLRKA
jgi:hypothetical protein